MSKPFLPSHRVSLKQTTIAFVSLLFVLFLIRFRAFTHFTEAYLGGFERDAGLYIWLLKSNCRDFFSSAWFNTAGFFPYTKTLAWSDSFLFPSLLACGPLKLGASPIVLWNILILGSEFLNGFCTFLLCFSLSGVFLPSLFAGTAFLSYGYFSATLGHPQLQFAFWIPLVLFGYFSFLRKPTIFRSILVGVLAGLCFLTTVYYAIFSAIMIAVLFVFLALLRPRFFTQKIILLHSGILLGSLFFLPFILPYFDVRSTFGKRHIYEAYYFAANIGSYFSTSAQHFLYSLSSSFSHPEAYLFPGFLIFILALSFVRYLAREPGLRKCLIVFSLLFLAAAFCSYNPKRVAFMQYLCAGFLWGALLAVLWYLKRLGKLEAKLQVTFLTNHSLIVLLLALSFFFFALSFGPLGNPVKGQYAPGIFSALYYIFPGIDSLRAISRVGMLSVFFLILTTPFALQRIWKKYHLPALALIPVFPLLLIENLYKDYPLQHEIYPDPVFYSLQNRVKKNDVIIVLPFTEKLRKNNTVKSWGDFAEKNVNALHHSFPLRNNIVNGYSGMISKIMRRFPWKIESFPDDRSITALSTIPNLQYIIYRSSNVENFLGGPFAERITRFPGQLRFIEKDVRHNYLFEFHPETDLSKPFFLRVPSYPDGNLFLELRGEHPLKKSIEVQLSLKNHFSEKPFLKIPLESGAAWKTFTVPVPETSDTVRPVYVEFQIPEGSRVYLKSRRYQANR